MAYGSAYRPEMTLTLAVIAGLSLLFGGDASQTTGNVPNPEAEAVGKLHQCASCHGEDGISKAEIFPNLASQQKDYIVAQLTAFRDHTRQDRDAKSYMWGMATGLSDDTIKALAAIYSAKSPAVAVAASDTAFSDGETIFKKGVVAHGVLACASCHGAHAEGNAVIPRLAGQHKDYLVVQLGAFASGSRDNAIMHPIAKGMTPGEIEAVSAYLSSL